MAVLKEIRSRTSFRKEDLPSLRGFTPRLFMVVKTRTLAAGSAFQFIRDQFFQNLPRFPFIIPQAQDWRKMGLLIENQTLVIHISVKIDRQLGNAKKGFLEIDQLRNRPLPRT